MDCYIYKITCVKNGKYYVGSTGRSVEDRWNEHLGDLKENQHNRKFQATFNKYGEDSLAFEVLGEYPAELQYDIETSYLQFIKKTDRKNSLNIKFVGRGFEKGNEPYNKGKKLGPMTEENKQKISKGKKGKKLGPMTEENKQKISKGRKGQKPWNKGKPGSMTGIILTKSVCPHCGFEGGVGSMKRWHFDNCKHKRDE